MIKRWLLALGLLTLVCGNAVAQMAFVEGVDYKAISPAVKTSQPDKVVVTEIFWYGCPHCFRFEPYVTRWSASLPDGVVVRESIAVFIGCWVVAAIFFLLQFCPCCVILFFFFWTGDFGGFFHFKPIIIGNE